MSKLYMSDNAVNLVSEKADTEYGPIIGMSIPLLTRVFELVREGVTSDANLHFVLEKIIDEAADGPLSMVDYECIEAANPKPVK